MAIAIAIKRMYNALEELYIDGIQTNTELHRNMPTRIYHGEDKYAHQLAPQNSPYPFAQIPNIPIP